MRNTHHILPASKLQFILNVLDSSVNLLHQPSMSLSVNHLSIIHQPRYIVSLKIRAHTCTHTYTHTHTHTHTQEICYYINRSCELMCSLIASRAILIPTLVGHLMSFVNNTVIKEKEFGDNSVRSMQAIGKMLESLHACGEVCAL